MALDYKDFIDAGGYFEDESKRAKSTKFIDALLPNRAMIEMKSKGENLDKHIFQLREYWNNSYGEKKTPFAILCNFEEFWIFNWYMQDQPLDKIKIDDLPHSLQTFSFLLKTPTEPIFGNNVAEVTKEATKNIIKVYKGLLERKTEPLVAQKFVLQCIVCMFAEDANLFPKAGFFIDLIRECKEKPEKTYDLFRSLFLQMNERQQANGGIFKGVPYFNGGIFKKITPVELNSIELELLENAAKCNWSKIEPSIFGNIFEDSMDSDERHATGSHYTYEKDIMLIIRPTLIEPLLKEMADAETLGKLNTLHNKISEMKILDPACGSGNFLYLAFRELKKLEIELFRKMLNYKSVDPIRLISRIKASQFFGIDINPFAVELAKITLAIGKKFAADELNAFYEHEKQMGFTFHEEPLPFDNLDENIKVSDALLESWPEADIIIGNPPYQSKNKMQGEMDIVYIDKIRAVFSEVSGMVDFCVYWFRKAHCHLKINGRAGLVGTNTIRQTNSRKDGLGYIVEHDGHIINAVSTMPWSGAATVHVSIVNWVKSVVTPQQKKFLLFQNEDNKKWDKYELDFINSSLSLGVDVSKASDLKTNINSNTCHQGQTHGHKGFLVAASEALKLLEQNSKLAAVLKPYMIQNELVGSKDNKIQRYVIDFGDYDIYKAQQYSEIFKKVSEKVEPTRKAAFEKEERRNQILREANPKAHPNHHHLGFYKNWWQLSYPRAEMKKALQGKDRFIACGQVTKRPIFEFISKDINPNAALMVFTMNDDYSFGILQSNLHWEWFKARCSTMKSDWRYTSTTIFDSFPWPQFGILGLVEKIKETKKPEELVLAVAEAARNLRNLRNKLRADHKLSLRELYRTLELPGRNPLKDAQDALDKAVREAYYYGLSKEMKNTDELTFLFGLNQKCYAAEKNGKKII